MSVYVKYQSELFSVYEAPNKKIYAKYKIVKENDFYEKYINFRFKIEDQKMFFSKYETLNNASYWHDAKDFDHIKSYYNNGPTIEHINIASEEYFKIENNCENLLKKYDVKKEIRHNNIYTPQDIKIDRESNSIKIKDFKKYINRNFQKELFTPPIYKEYKYDFVHYGLKKKNYELPIVYFLFDDDELVYVGKTYSYWPNRIKNHLWQGYKKFNRVAYIYFDEVDKNKLYEIESFYIRFYDPKYNKRYW